MKLEDIFEKIRAAESDIQDIMWRAGEAVMQIYQDPATTDVQIKADTSPLTAADLASHKIITQEIKQLFPDWPILSEESDEKTIENHQSWDVYWLIDPLDGTKEFINRSGEFTLNLALIASGKPVAGWVYAPVIGELYLAFDQSAALVTGLNDESTKQQIHARPIADRPSLLMSRRHGTELMEQAQSIFERLYGPCETFSRGSSLKICEVAVGRADFYPRLGPTHEWDTAAAHAILNAAGGTLVNLSGIPLDYNQKENTLNPYFIAVGDPKHEALPELLSELKALCAE